MNQFTLVQKWKTLLKLDDFRPTTVGTTYIEKVNHWTMTINYFQTCFANLRQRKVLKTIFIHCIIYIINIHYIYIYIYTLYDIQYWHPFQFCVDGWPKLSNFDVLGLWRIIFGTFWASYGFAKSCQYCINMVFKTLRGRRLAKQVRKQLIAIVQWLTFPWSHHVTGFNNVGRSYSGRTEIIRF